MFGKIFQIMECLLQQNQYFSYCSILFPMDVSGYVYASISVLCTFLHNFSIVVYRSLFPTFVCAFVADTAVKSHLVPFHTEKKTPKVNRQLCKRDQKNACAHTSRTKDVRISSLGRGKRRA